MICVMGVFEYVCDRHVLVCVIGMFEYVCEMLLHQSGGNFEVSHGLMAPGSL